MNAICNVEDNNDLVSNIVVPDITAQSTTEFLLKLMIAVSNLDLDIKRVYAVSALYANSDYFTVIINRVTGDYMMYQATPRASEYLYTGNYTISTGAMRLCRIKLDIIQ